MAVLFGLQSVLTIAVVEGRVPAWPFRPISVAGAVALAVAGVAAVLTNLNRAHFEGYALVIGALLVFQGALTCLPLSTVLPSSSSKVHPFVD